MYYDDDIYYRKNPGNGKKSNKGIAKILKGVIYCVFTVMLSVGSMAVYMEHFYPAGVTVPSATATTSSQQTTQPTNNVQSTPTQGIITSVAAAGSGETLTIPQIYQKVAPSVVGITCEVALADDWFGRTSTSTVTGTGIIMSTDGYIATNAHVVSGAQQVTVTLPDASEHEATVVGCDTITDLAVLKIDATGLTAAEFGDSDALVPGESAVCIGNPLGLEFASSITNGIISAINRDVTINDQKMTLIQTNAAINPGNSGGPLVNEYGQVVGITSVKISSTDTEGMGFAIPMNYALPLLQQLIDQGYIGGRPEIGLDETVDISQQMANYYRIPEGVYVKSIKKGSAADLAGIKAEDIITSIDGTDVSSIGELNTVRDDHKVGDTVTLKVYRNDQYLNINITLLESTEG